MPTDDSIENSDLIENSDSKFSAGDLVKWTPSDQGVAATIPLERNHPGRIAASPDPQAIFVDWVDRHGPLALEGAFDEAWLTAISAEEFEELSAAIRQRRDEREAAGRRAGKTYAERPTE